MNVGSIVVIGLGVLSLVLITVALIVLFRDEYRNHVDPE